MDRRFRSRSPAVLMRRCCRLMSVRFVTMNPTGGNSSPAWSSTSATTRFKQVQVSAWHAKLLSNEGEAKEESPRPLSHRDAREGSG